MAESVQLAIGIINLTSLFTTCLDAFEYIKLGRQVGRDYQALALRLDILKLRLSRWGECINEFDGSHQLDEAAAQHVKTILRHIEAAFSTAEAISSRYGVTLEDEHTAAVSGVVERANGDYSLLRSEISKLALQRQKRISFAEKARWMLKDRNKLETLINDVSVLIDSLVDLFPFVQDRQVKLSVEDVQSLQQDAGPTLERLEESGVGFGEIVANVDPILEWCIRIKGRLILDESDVGGHLPTYEEAISELALSHKGIDREKYRGTDPYTRFFSTASYKAAKDAHSQKAYHGKEWILEHPTYRKWRYGSDSNILWLTGDAGSGKSAFSRILVDENFLQTQSAGVAYYFFESKDDRGDAANTLCALLHQIFSSFDNLSRKYAKAAIEEYGPTLRDDIDALWDILVQVAGDSSSGNVICVLDSVETCRNNSHKANFLERLVDWHSNTYEGKLKFLLTSRPQHGLAGGLAQSMRPVAVLQLGALRVSPPALREAGSERTKVECLHLGGTMMQGYTGQCKAPNITFSDTLKNAVERALHQPIIWWPLKDPVRPKPKGTHRIAWKCDCNALLYGDVPNGPLRINAGDQDPLDSLYRHRIVSGLASKALVTYPSRLAALEFGGCGAGGALKLRKTQSCKPGL